MDFSDFSRPTGISKPIDPKKIFNSLPTLPGVPNDLWDGQGVALSSWHENREATDVLVALNTGAGKTIVGLLMAQSLVNEGVENVVYACSTVDLVIQTQREAQQLGIKCTVRHGGEFDNELFDTGEAFCIVTYSYLFNSLGKLRNSTRPGAIIFDDAHVAEKALRETFTLKVTASALPNSYAQIVSMAEPYFDQRGRIGSFRDFCNGVTSNFIMAPPRFALENKNTILDCLSAEGVPNSRDHMFSYHNIKDNFDKCCFIFGHQIVEITPPFIPIFSIPFLDNRTTRRIYLSATMEYKADIARTFGRVPDVIIEPQNDAGNGERLIVFSSELKDAFPSTGGVIDSPLVDEIASKNKMVIATPSYKAANKWKKYAQPPSVEEFTTKLNEFRDAPNGIFSLVSRVDGIDLPHDVCRVMVMDELPMNSSALESMQWNLLNMRNMFANKIANRITQLFGRINRGRKDYGAFIISGYDLNTWLKTPRYRALLPDLVRKQIELGLGLHDQGAFDELSKVAEVIDSVVSTDADGNRNESWLAFYGASIQGTELDTTVKQRAKQIEDIMTKSALAEVQFASALWDNDFKSARRHLEEVHENVSKVDPTLAGWHCIWIGMCLEAEGDIEAARKEYYKAHTRLERRMVLEFEIPRTENQAGEKLNEFVSAVFMSTNGNSEKGFLEDIAALDKVMSDLAHKDAGSNKHEEAVRTLGDMMGFKTSRPDNTFNKGPDVLWLCEDTNSCFSFELKTGKQEPATYKKDDIGQGFNHLEWVAGEYPEYKDKGLIFVGPSGSVSDNATPSDNMYHCEVGPIIDLANSFKALLQDTRKLTPVERLAKANAAYETLGWGPQSIFSRVAVRNISELG